jgi:cell division protein FtsZ
LLEASMEGARGVLMSIAGGSDLGLFEINEAASLVQEAAHIDANIIFGTVIDDSLGDEVRITVIAAGFDAGKPTHRPDPARSTTTASGSATIGAARAGEVGQHTNGHPSSYREREREREPVIPPIASPIDEVDDDVDVPSFMRR